MTTAESCSTSWWKGRRGEGYVLLQVGLFVLIAAGPATAPGLPAFSPGPHWLSSGIAAVLMGLGALFVLAGATGLGANLSPLPYPKDSGRLIESGIYGILRHPMYGGAVWVAAGWALWTHGLLTLAYAVLLFVFLDAKASQEERWLCEKFPGYAAYRKRVRKLIPFVY